MEDEVGDPRLETMLYNLGKWLRRGKVVDHVAVEYLDGGLVSVRKDVIEYESSLDLFD